VDQERCPECDRLRADRNVWRRMCIDLFVLVRTLIRIITDR
jgi:hypothetical protein